MKSICVYLGAKFGNSTLFKDVVVQLANQIAHSNFRLVYGGSSLGLMGLLVLNVNYLCRLATIIFAGFRFKN
jgi:predicted Rossmann-fold nucleotide-binding protein